jgi:hypothetical protein
MFSPHLLALISRYQLAAVALAAALTLVLWTEAAPGVVLGGAVMAGNFWIMRTALQKLVGDGTSSRAKLLYGLFLVSKFFLVMGALALLVLVVRVHPLGIAVGMLSLFVGIGLAVAHRALAPAS